VFALFGVVTRSPEMAKIWLYVLPIGVLVVGIGFVVAVLRAAGDDDHDAPAIRLCLAAGFTTFSLGVSSILAIILYKQRVSPDEVMRALDVAGPAATMLGLLCLVSAIGSVAERTRLTVTREATVRVGVLVVVVFGAAVALQQYLAGQMSGADAREAGAFAIAALSAAIASLVAMLSVARLSQRISADLHGAGEGAALPRAELRDDAAGPP
jgi:predicted permease